MVVTLDCNILPAHQNPNLADLFFFPGAISRHAAIPSNASTFHPYSPGRSFTRGGQTSRGHGRGRGSRTYGLDLRAANKTSAIATIKSSSRPATPLEPAMPEEKEAGELSPPPSAPADDEVQAPDQGKESELSWVKKTSKGGNMSLMTVKKRCVASSIAYRD